GFKSHSPNYKMNIMISATLAGGRAARTGPLTFFPGWGVPVYLIIFLFIPQVTGVHGHRCFDFLLGHLHSVIEDFEESF
uniref:Uncharacterized protein n=1 Tax=Neovison vison TaxID=452646 RepID=A0A8C7BAW3_NEOVI